MGKKTLGFRVPEQWHSEIQERCAELGISPSDFLLEATAKALEKDVSDVSRGSPLLEAQRVVSSRVTTVEQSLALLTTRLTELEQKGIPRQAPKPRRSKSSSKRPKPAPKTPEPPSEGEYSLKDICERYGWSYHNFRRNAGLKKQTLLQYLRERSGIDWGESNGRYAPPDTELESQGFLSCAE